MEASCHKDGDDGIGVAFADSGEQLRHYDFTGHWPGVVAGDDDDVVLANGEFFKARAGDGIVGDTGVGTRTCCNGTATMY